MDDFKSFLNENKEKLKIESAIDRHLNDYSSDFSKGKKLRPMRRKNYRRDEHKGKIKVLTNNREYDFMKYYFLVKTWASVRYGLKFEEIEFLMYFYLILQEVGFYVKFMLIGKILLLFFKRVVAHNSYFKRFIVH